MSYQQSRFGGTRQGLEPVPYILVHTVINLQQLVYINNVGNRQEQIKTFYRCTLLQLQHTHILQIYTLNKRSRSVASPSAGHGRCNVLISCHILLIAQKKQDRFFRKSLLKAVFKLEQYNLFFTILI